MLISGKLTQLVNQLGSHWIIMPLAHGISPWVLRSPFQYLYHHAVTVPILCCLIRLHLLPAQFLFFVTPSITPISSIHDTDIESSFSSHAQNVESSSLPDNIYWTVSQTAFKISWLHYNATLLSQLAKLFARIHCSTIMLYYYLCLLSCLLLIAFDFHITRHKYENVSTNLDKIGLPDLMFLFMLYLYKLI